MAAVSMAMAITAHRPLGARCDPGQRVRSQVVRRCAKENAPLPSGERGWGEGATPDESRRLPTRRQRLQDRFKNGIALL
jgi:hypothetical protein